MLHVGFGEADITPKPGSESPGGSARRIIEKVDDPLKVVAMVVRTEDGAAALVGIDTLFTPGELTAGARAAIAAKTEIPPDRILIGASHTHSGGPLATCFGSEADPEYGEKVRDKVGDAVIMAWNAMHAAEIGVGAEPAPGIAFNRRFLMRDGRQVTHPGKGNPRIVRVAGPTDPDVGVLAARLPGGDLLGLFVHFTCHSTVGRFGGFSADYAFDLREALRAQYSRPDLPVGFLLGAAGDVTQVDNLRPGTEFGAPWSRMMGRTLGASATRAIARMEWKAALDLRGVRTVVPIPIREPRDLKDEAPSEGLGSGADWEKIYAGERQFVERRRSRSPVVDCEVQAIRIGNLGLVTNGAEFFCQHGLDIKAASPLPTTWVTTLANDYIGYVGTATAYYAGGYEPRTARSAFLAPQAGQLLVEGSLAALGKVV